MSIPLPGGQPNEADFDDALAQARAREVHSEWPFSQRVIEALEAVAADPTRSNVQRARVTWSTDATALPPEIAEALDRVQRG